MIAVKKGDVPTIGQRVDKSKGDDAYVPDLMVALAMLLERSRHTHSNGDATIGNADHSIMQDN